MMVVFIYSNCLKQCCNCTFNIYGFNQRWCRQLSLCLCVYDRSEPVTMALCHFSHSVPEILSWTQSRLYPCSQCCISAAWLDA